MTSVVPANSGAAFTNPVIVNHAAIRSRSPRALRNVESIDSNAPTAAWQERDQARLERGRQVAERLHDEGGLRGEGTGEVAAALLWGVTSPAVWEDLVLNLGWSNAKYVKYVMSVLEQGLLTAPPSRF